MLCNCLMCLCLKPVVPLTTVVRPTVVATPGALGMPLQQVQPSLLMPQLASSLFAPAQLTGANLAGTGDRFLLVKQNDFVGDSVLIL
jgi:hypothetical protein